MTAAEHKGRFERNATGRRADFRPSRIFNFVETDRRKRLGSQIIAMVESTESRHGYDFATHICICCCDPARGGPLL